jgi:RNA polymerase sigma-70 factor (ECF subfamily)
MEKRTGTHDHQDLDERLSRITTMWTLVIRANQESIRAEDSVRAKLVERYQGAAYRYVLGAVRDPDVADELFQEFALRIVRGAMRQVTPERGRFRDYLKRVLANLITDYRRGVFRRVPAAASEVPEPSCHDESVCESDRLFLQGWRTELLSKAWQQLSQREQVDRQPYYSVLRFRAEHPDASSAVMAMELTKILHPARPYSDDGVRKTLQRARELFADILLDEVAASLESSSIDELECELSELELLDYCRSAVARRRQMASG